MTAAITGPICLTTDSPITTPSRFSWPIDLNWAYVFDGHHHADERPDDADDGDGFDADLVQLRQEKPDVLPAEPAGKKPFDGPATEGGEVPEVGQSVAGGSADGFDERQGHCGDDRSDRGPAANRLSLRSMRRPKYKPAGRVAIASRPLDPVSAGPAGKIRWEVTPIRQQL